MALSFTLTEDQESELIEHFGEARRWSKDQIAAEFEVLVAEFRDNGEEPIVLEGDLSLFFWQMDHGKRCSECGTADHPLRVRLSDTASDSTVCDVCEEP